jgi:hypothetical protein
MRATEEAKHAQWGPVYGDEWIPRWVYPDRLVENGEALTFDGVSFRVFEVGPGGDCDANSVWILDDELDAAFVGTWSPTAPTPTSPTEGSCAGWRTSTERRCRPSPTRCPTGSVGELGRGARHGSEAFEYRCPSGAKGGFQRYSNTFRKISNRFRLDDHAFMLLGLRRSRRWKSKANISRLR